MAKKKKQIEEDVSSENTSLNTNEEPIASEKVSEEKTTSAAKQQSAFASWGQKK